MGSQEFLSSSAVTQLLGCGSSQALGVSASLADTGSSTSAVDAEKREHPSLTVMQRLTRNQLQAAAIHGASLWGAKARPGGNGLVRYAFAGKHAVA